MLAAYCAAKAGVTGLVRGLAAELRGTGVTANAVSPGSTDTPILAESARLYGLEDAASFAPQQPIERLIRPEEVAAAIRWLLSAEAAAVTGATFAVEPLDAQVAGETAQRWRYLDGGGEIGVISSVTQAFCRDCNRARLSTEGRLYLCLFAHHGHDLRHLLRQAGASDAEVSGAIAEIWSGRSDRYSELRGRGLASSSAGERKVEMHYIGG